MDDIVLPNTLGLERMLMDQAFRPVPPTLDDRRDDDVAHNRHEQNNLSRHLVSLRACFRLEPDIRKLHGKQSHDLTTWADEVIPRLTERLHLAIRADITGMEKALCDIGMFYSCIDGEEERVHLTRHHYIVVS